VAEQEVSFSSGDIQLAGTLMVPDSGGPFPVVLLVPGSGQVDRNENHKRMPLNAFREIATHLAEHGFASLRYDKRGVGASGGDYWSTGFFDNASDVLSALEFLKSQEVIRKDAVFLVGHSEGAQIATRLAGQGVDVAGVVLLSGTAQRGENALKWQARQVADGMKGLNRLLIKLLRIDIIKAQQKYLDKIKRSTKDFYRVQLVTRLNAKWMREFIDYDPAEDLTRIKVPVLAVTGSKDIQVDPADLKRMAELVPGDFEYAEIPNGTHLLRVEEGRPGISNYKKQIRQPMDPRILSIVTEWLKKRLDTAGG
jgi:pimeloyl-ACP methyl ester carboxylesterase